MASPTKILFANDDPIYLNLMQYLLIDAGYPDVVVVLNIDAYNAVRAHKPGLVLLDINTGAAEKSWAALDLLVLDPTTNHIPLIICTTDMRLVRDKAAWLDSHHIRVLEKPFNVPEVLDTISVALGIV